VAVGGPLPQPGAVHRVGTLIVVGVDEERSRAVFGLKAAILSGVLVIVSSAIGVTMALSRSGTTMAWLAGLPIIFFVPYVILSAVHLRRLRSTSDPT
jgi:hypothetical protein